MLLFVTYDTSVHHHFLLLLGMRWSILTYVFNLPFLLYTLTYIHIQVYRNDYIQLHLFENDVWRDNLPSPTICAKQ